PRDLPRIQYLRKPGTTTDSVLSALLGVEGMHDTDVGLGVRVTNSDRPFDLLKNDVIDGYTGYLLTGLWRAKQENVDVRVLHPADYGVAFYGDSLFALDQLIENEAESLQKFLRATQLGWRYALKYPDEISERIVSDLPRVYEVPDLLGFNKFQAEIIADLIEQDRVVIGHTNMFRWQKMHLAMKKSGVIAGEFDSSMIVDQGRLDDLAHKDDHLIYFYMALAVIMGGGFIFIGVKFYPRKTSDHIIDTQKEALIVNASKDHSLAVFDDVNELLMDKLSFGVICTQLDGQIVICNNAASTILNLPNKDILNRKISDFIPLLSHEYLLELADDDDSTLEAFSSGETHATGSGSSIKEIAFNIRKATLNQRELFVFSLRDLSERKDLEQRYLRAQRMDAVGRLAGGIAHDFNNLLAIMLGNVELIEMSPEAVASAGNNIEALKRSIQKGTSLTGRLLAFSREKRSDMRPVEMLSLCSDLQDFLRRSLPENIQIDFDYTVPPTYCLLDPSQFEHAIVNLVINSRDAIQGSGKIRLRLREPGVGDNVFIDFDQSLVVEVEDTGAGIPKEVIHQVTEPFFTTKDIGKGNGLGLSMVFEFVEQSGGKMFIESPAGEGATIKLVFPTVSQVEEKISEKRSGVDDTAVHSEHILVVEDEKGLCEIVGPFLEKKGYKVTLCHTADEAHDVFLQSRSGSLEEIDVLLTDVILPGELDGVKLAQLCRKASPALRVLYVSGYAEHDTSKLTQKTFQEGYLPKPYSLTGLSQLLSVLINGTRIMLVTHKTDEGQYIYDIIREAGYNVVWHERLIDAMKHVEEHAPDIILTEVILPTGDGYDLLNFIRKKQLPSKVYGMSDQEDFLTGFKNIGGDGVLIKPITKDHILNLLSGQIVVQKRKSAD
ncbi:MAG: response regulator, partial [Alphaproteobacteria bacterium]|nr:response regulator [Alphaproteobacteria bacterium]